ncbi:uncharacterized protein V6R79_003943 [Siganus canaliculatus]
MATLDAADSPGELAHMLNKAYKKIANLLEDIDRMSSELQRKDSVLITLSSHHVGFINNFDLFWERRHLFGPDGLHLNRAGARMLSGNLAYGIQHAIITKPAPAALSHTD